MAYFARLDANNIVRQVIVVSDEDIKDRNGVEVERIGAAFCQKLLGAETNWKQTSYNATSRGNYAGVGMTYMSNVSTLGLASTDIFIKVQPYESWTVGVNTASWFAPIAKPALTSSQISDNKTYSWDEVAYQADTSDPKTVGWTLSTRPL